MNSEQPDGGTLREHLLSIERQTGFTPKEMEYPCEFPLEFKNCWDDFIALNNTRASGFGPSPITYTEMQNYANLMGFEFEPWEVQMIKLFDKLALESYNEKQKTEPKKTK